MKVNVLLKLFFILIINCFLLNLATNKIIASINLPYSENFSSGLLSNWDIYSPSSGSSFAIINDELVGNAYPNPKVVHYAKLNDEGWENYIFEVSVKGLLGADKPILFRFDENGSFYSINLRGGGYNDIELNKRLVVSGTQYHSKLTGSPLNSTIVNNQWYTIKVSVKNIGSTVLMNVYLDNDLVIDNYSDSSNPIYKGSIGAAIWPEGDGESVAFDNITVSAIPDPSPSFLPVPDIKQGTSPWGTQEYDSAHKWAAANPTISRWGCALTSAVMAMRYHGFIDVWPDILNNWLKATPGGYTRNGGVNWLAIARYTKLFPNSSGESLEYKFFKDNLLYFSTLIDKNMVPIVNFPSHFLIAKGYTSIPDYLINDPASDLTTLSTAITKWGNVKKIAYYQLSKSDLSYLYFVADPNVNLNLFNSSGNQISMEYLLSEPLTDDIDPTIHGPGPFGEYYLSQPPIDKYKLEITGNGPYSIDSYFYDIEGKVKIATISGTITANNNIDKYTLTYNYQNPTIIKDRIITINVLIEDIQNAWKQKQILSYPLYAKLKNQAIIVKVFLKFHQYRSAKEVLKSMNFSLERAKTNNILSSAKQLLLEDINFLISSLP